MPTLASTHAAACSAQSSSEAACLSWKSAAAASACRHRLSKVSRMPLALLKRNVEWRTSGKLVVLYQYLSCMCCMEMPVLFLCSMYNVRYVHYSILMKRASRMSFAFYMQSKTYNTDKKVPWSLSSDTS